MSQVCRIKSIIVFHPIDPIYLLRFRLNCRGVQSRCRQVGVPEVVWPPEAVDGRDASENGVVETCDQAQIVRNLHQPSRGRRRMFAQQNEVLGPTAAQQRGRLVVTEKASEG